MTVLELIDVLEEVEDLDAVYISENGLNHIYENEDIDFIEGRILNSLVKRYQVQSKTVKNHTVRTVDIEC